MYVWRGVKITPPGFYSAKSSFYSAECGFLLRLGDRKTFASTGYVSTPPEKGKEFLPGRTRWRSTWSKTGCSSLDRHKPAGPGLDVQSVSPGVQCKNASWSLADSNAHAGKERHATFHAGNSTPTR